MLCYDKPIDRTLLRKGAISLELISKKQLLAETGISYGQLYRWKRERLIPEGWFIKQSSYTGQETFFPKEDVYKRQYLFSPQDSPAKPRRDLLS